jgi:hypothetical protein
MLRGAKGRRLQWHDGKGRIPTGHAQECGRATLQGGPPGDYQL